MMFFKNRLVLCIVGRHIKKDLNPVELGVKYGLK